MPASFKFHGLIAAMTVAVMYGATLLLAPLLRGLSDETKFLSALAAILTSLGIYMALARGLTWLFQRSLWVKAWVLGPAFMHGTWIGHSVGRGGNKRYVVERFEQDLSAITIIGRSYTEDDVVEAHWSTEATSFDTTRGRLVYAYSCIIVSPALSHEGLGNFRADRGSVNAPPTEINGYVADLVDGDRTSVHEVMIDRALLPWPEALARAKARFKDAKPPIGEAAAA